MIIRKKSWPDVFQKVLEGKKKVELRLADFECHPGDALILEEWDPQTRKYTGRSIKRKAAHVLKTKDVKFWPKEEIEKYGFLVIRLD